MGDWMGGSTGPEAVEWVDTPWGPFFVSVQAGAITDAGWAGAGRAPGDAAPGPNDVTQEAAKQIREYLDREREVFDLPLRVLGSDLVRRVCDVMCAIPFGVTRTYGDLSRELGRPAQAIGQACGGNPIPLIIPCHRILSATGLGGFSAPGGVETKVGLLRHEGAAGLMI